LDETRISGRLNKVSYISFVLTLWCNGIAQGERVAHLGRIGDISLVVPEVFQVPLNGGRVGEGEVTVPTTELQLLARGKSNVRDMRYASVE
jgi:hypothetical protein